MRSMTQAALAAAFLLGLSAAAQAQSIQIGGGAGAIAGGISGAISTVHAGPGGGPGDLANAAETRITGGTSVAITVNNGVTISTNHALTLTGITQGNHNVSADLTGISGSFQFEGFGVGASFSPF